MGTQSSKGKKYAEAAKYGEIYLQTDKSTYFSGELVTGNIYINLKLPYPGNQLFLKIKGKESVILEQMVSTGSSVIPIQYKDKNYLLNQSSPLYSWDSLLPGNFVIPFTFTLPFGLPSSFRQEGSGYRAFVKYQIEAFLQPFDPKGAKLKHKQILIIKEPVSNAMQDCISETTTKLKSFGFISKGTSNLKANFEKNYYTPGETANVTLQFDNSNSELKSKSFVLSLKQRLCLKAKGHKIEKTFKKQRQELPGVPQEGPQQAIQLSLVLPPFKGDDYSIFSQEPKSSYLTGLKEDLYHLSSSTKSSLITSEYYLEVKCPMKGMFTTTPKIACPIMIYEPVGQLPVVNPPENWAPLTLQSINASFESDMSLIKNT